MELDRKAMSAEIARANAAINRELDLLVERIGPAVALTLDVTHDVVEADGWTRSHPRVAVRAYICGGDA